MLDEAFAKLKTNLEPSTSFEEKISQHHNAVRSVVKNGHPNADTKLIGSLARKTRIQPRDKDTFDIDILVILGEFTGWGPNGVSPIDALGTVHAVLSDTVRYGEMAPNVDAPTVSFEYADKVKVELVPAYRNNIGYDENGNPHLPVGRGYWIPKNGRWIFADYDHEASHITVINEAVDGTLIPFIKMLKALRRMYFPQLGSFPLEIIASKVLPLIMINNIKQGIPNTWHVLVSDFFSQSPEHLINPIQVPGSNSPAIMLDELARNEVARAFKVIGDFSREVNSRATEQEKLSGWKSIFGDVLPLI